MWTKAIHEQKQVSHTHYNAPYVFIPHTNISAARTPKQVLHAFFELQVQP